MLKTARHAITALFLLAALFVTAPAQPLEADEDAPLEVEPVREDPPVQPVGSELEALLDLREIMKPDTGGPGHRLFRPYWESTLGADEAVLPATHIWRTTPEHSLLPKGLLSKPRAEGGGLWRAYDREDTEEDEEIDEDWRTTLRVLRRSGSGLVDRRSGTPYSYDPKARTWNRTRDRAYRADEFQRSDRRQENRTTYRSHLSREGRVNRTRPSQR